MLGVKGVYNGEDGGYIIDSSTNMWFALYDLSVNIWEEKFT
jgi:hypothetical protein